MDEYISREETLKAFRLTAKNSNKDYQRGLQDAIDCLIPEVIAGIPSADVQPVRYGRWIIEDDVEHFIAICSECGRTEDSRDIKDMPYCHCGARMDGDAK